MSAKSTNYIEVFTNSVEIVVIIPNTTAVYHLSGGNDESLTKIVYQLDNLATKFLQPKCPKFRFKLTFYFNISTLLQFKQ